MFQVGQRVILTQPVCFHDAGACGQIDIELPAGAAGTVVDVGDTLNRWVIVRLDQTFACLDDWANCVTFDQDGEGDAGVGIASEYLSDMDHRIMRMASERGLLTVAHEAEGDRIDWNHGPVYCDWRRQVGSFVRSIWHTLSPGQRIAIACDAHLRERDIEERAQNV